MGRNVRECKRKRECGCVCVCVFLPYFFIPDFRMFYLAAMPETDDSNSCFTKGLRCSMDQRCQKGVKKLLFVLRLGNVRQLRQGVQTRRSTHWNLWWLSMKCSYLFFKSLNKFQGMMAKKVHVWCAQVWCANPPVIPRHLKVCSDLSFTDSVSMLIT